MRILIRLALVLALTSIATAGTSGAATANPQSPTAGVSSLRDGPGVCC
jgi:hypothetical protein